MGCQHVSVPGLVAVAIPGAGGWALPPQPPGGSATAGGRGLGPGAGPSPAPRGLVLQLPPPTDDFTADRGIFDVVLMAYFWELCD